MNPITSTFCFPPVRISRLLAGLAAIGLLLGATVRAQDGAARPPPPAAPAIFSGSQMAPDYPVPYRPPTVEEITAVMNRVREYQEGASLMRIISRQTREEITDLTKPHPDAVLDRGENNSFPLISYEEGVTYAGMLLAAEVTGDARFTAFTTKRFQFVADHLPFFAAAIEHLTGTMPFYIDGPQRESRRDIFGLITEAHQAAHPSTEAASV